MTGSELVRGCLLATSVVGAATDFGARSTPPAVSLALILVICLPWLLFVADEINADERR